MPVVGTQGGGPSDALTRASRDPDQAWFWTPEWQAKEREADADKAAGNVERFESDEAFLAALDERRGSSDADV